MMEELKASLIKKQAELPNIENIISYTVLEEEIKDTENAINAITQLHTIFTNTTSSTIYNLLGKNLFKKEYEAVEAIEAKRNGGNK